MGKSKDKQTRPKREYVLFLVEGDTDILVLSGPIQDLYKEIAPNKIVKFCKRVETYGQVGGDLTSDMSVNPDNILGLIAKVYIDPFLNNNPSIYAKEIKEIIQVTDLDGAFIPPDYVKQVSGDVSKNVIYYDDKIEANNAEGIRKRNKSKSDNLKRLIETNEIKIRHNLGRNQKSIKYSIYYFSANMDHVMFNKTNLATAEKVELAGNFQADCCFTTEPFVNIIYDNNYACVGMTYEESWNMVMQGTESLKRHTNLNLLVDRIKVDGEK